MSCLLEFAGGINEHVEQGSQLMNSYGDFQKSRDKHNSPETNIRASLTLRVNESSGRG